jgi:Domain of unknown function (DUF4349)
MRRIMIPTALLIATLALAGCSAAPASDSSGGLAPGGVVAPDAPEAIDKGGLASDGSVTDGSVTDGSIQPDRSVITTGTVTVTAEEPLEASKKAASIVEAAGGRVDARQENAPVNGDKGSATLTLRIPATVLTPTLEKLKALGKVEQVSISANDVTSQVEDIDARIRALEASVDRLIALLSTASDAQVLVTIETSLTDRQASLESLQAQQRSLADQTSMSTITLTLISVADAPVQKPDNFLTGLLAGWNAFVAFLSGLLVVLGVLLPWLVFLAIITFVIIFFVRRAIKKAALANPMPVMPPAPTK